MTKLLKKEFTLALHPTAYFFLCFCLFVFIPNYPYEVMFFFSCLSVFFTCLNGRENKDLLFSCMLPVRKKEVAYARIISTVIMQLSLIALAACAVAVKNLVPAVNAANLAGLDANAALIGEGFLILGVFNIVFFPIYFSSPDKVGAPFVVASACVFVLIAVSVSLCAAIIGFKNTFDTPDPIFIGGKMIFTSVCAVVYALLTILSSVLSAKKFEKVNL